MYLWIVIIGGLFAFFAAMGIGANDVANAYATAVGSKALTMRQAVGLATICETGGVIDVENTVAEPATNYGQLEWTIVDGSTFGTIEYCELQNTQPLPVDS